MKSYASRCCVKFKGLADHFSPPTLSGNPGVIMRMATLGQEPVAGWARHWVRRPLPSEIDGRKPAPREYPKRIPQKSPHMPTTQR